MTDSTSHSYSRDEAALYLIYFDMLRPSFLARQRIVWEHSLAAGILSPGDPSLSALSRQFLDLHFLYISREGPRPRVDGGLWPLDGLAMRLADNYRLHLDDGPPSLLLLAVRAARRAVRENPDDANAYQLLGEAYLHLIRNTRERTWNRDLPSLAHIRQIQTAVALHQALLLQPDLIQGHVDLYGLYRDMGLLDLALHHLGHVHRLSLSRSRFAGDTPEAQAERLRQVNQAVETLDKEVRRHLDTYETQAAHRPVLDQAILALELGLAGKALDILLASDVAVFGKRGTEMELDLLLTVGRIHDARAWMLPIQETDLGGNVYHRLRVLLAAASGDYEACDEELSQIAAPLDQPVTMVFHAHKFSHTAAKHPTPPIEQPMVPYRLQASPRQVVCLKFAQLLLNAPWQKKTIPQMFESRLQIAEFFEQIKGLSSDIRQMAEADVLRGAGLGARRRFTGGIVLAPRPVGVAQRGGSRLGWGT